MFAGLLAGSHSTKYLVGGGWDGIGTYLVHRLDITTQQLGPVGHAVRFMPFFKKYLRQAAAESVMS